MSIETILKKDGIEVIKELDTLKVNSIARNISLKICDTFPEFGLNKNDLFIKLSRLHMYKAKMEKGTADANYFYKNSSIYFNDNISDNDLEESAVHECIHYLQEIKDNRNTLIRMGLCDYTEFKTYGLALNEAAVQLMSSKINNTKKDYVKYFGLSFDSVSPSYYPLECCLVNQLAYLVGEDVLFESAINSNDNFKIKLAALISEKAFIAIQNSLDTILYNTEKIIKLNNKIAESDDRNKKIDSMIAKIADLKNEISLTFMRTQNLIISSYFDNSFNQIYSLEEIELYRQKLYTFKDYLASTEGYTFFNSYYVSKMEDLEIRSVAIENGEDLSEEISLKLITKKETLFIRFLKIFKRLLFNHNYQGDRIEE